MAEQFVAQSLDDLATPEQLAGMTGLEYITAILEGRLGGAPIAGTLNFQLQEVAAGRVVFRGSPRFEHLNPQRTVHGGWYGTLLDSALGCAVATMLPKGRGYTTLEYKVNLTRALPVGMVIDCIGVTKHVGRTTAVAEAEIRGVEDGKLYAVGSTTCIIFGG